jgi:hypothetical protein
MVNFLLGHKILLVVLAILVAAGVWFGLTSSSTSEGDSLLSSEVVSTGGPEQELVSTLLALRAVKLEGAIFSDPAFMSLKDYSTQIVPEAVGRPNPFAPLITNAPQQSAGIQNAPNFAPNGGSKAPSGNKSK